MVWPAYQILRTATWTKDSVTAPHIYASINKLLMKWHGPYSVVCKMAPVAYKIHHPDKGEATQTYHIHLLKEWKEPLSKPETSLLIREMEEDQVDEQPEPEARKPAQRAGIDLLHLEESKQAELHHLLDRYPSLLHQRPGQTPFWYNTKSTFLIWHLPDISCILLLRGWWCPWRQRWRWCWSWELLNPPRVSGAAQLLSSQRNAGNEIRSDSKTCSMTYCLKGYQALLKWLDKLITVFNFFLTLRKREHLESIVLEIDAYDPSISAILIVWLRAW